MHLVRMDDFSALAQRVVVSVGDVRGCLILSRDGMVLGAYPGHDEDLVKPAWLKFATLGDVDKSFVEFAEQIWVFVRRGPYASFAVAGASVRPGILIDQIEQALLAAEELRSKRDGLRLPEAPVAPSGRPRTSMHLPVERTMPAAAAAKMDEPPATAPAAWDVGAARATEASTPEEESGPETSEPPPQRGEPTLVGARQEVDEEVDRVILAQEFSGLLQMGEGDDEASS